MARWHPTDYVALFWSRVRKQPGNACWLWTGAPGRFGYGRASYGPYKVDLTHRVVWRITYGEIPAGACVLHHCDNPPCVRPDHLFLGDRGDNARDMAAKGRQHVQRHPERRPICPRELKVRGERHYAAKLTADQVLEIRHRYAAGERQVSLCRAYNISSGGLGSILRGISWRHVGGPIVTRKVCA